jgi:cytidyltransferase-like protein
MGKRIVIASGYFDPLHVGHLEYLTLARNLGDELWVIVNNDKQAVLKKGKPFMSAKDRSAIVSGLACVDGVVISIDEDNSICHTLKNISSTCREDDVIIFAKGGDRVAAEIPEADICRKLNIKVVDGLGDKIRNSSELTKQYSFRTRDGFELHEPVECVNSHEYPPLALLELPCKRTLYIRHIPQEGGDVLIDIHTQDTDWDSVTLEKKEHSNGVQLRLGYDFSELTDMTDYIENLDKPVLQENSIHTLLVPADGHPKGTKVVFKGMHNGNHMAIVSPVGEPDSQSLFCVALDELK